MADFLHETTRVRKRKEWRAYEDGLVTKEGVGAEIKILTPKSEELKFTIYFKCSLSNNEVEYEAV